MATHFNALLWGILLSLFGYTCMVRAIAKTNRSELLLYLPVWESIKDWPTFVILLGDLKNVVTIHRIHKWRTRGKKLVPSHESEALEGKQKLQMKTFSELAECLARIPPKITLYGLLFKYNYVGCLLLLMFSIDLLFAIKRDAYIFNETGWFCRLPKPQKLDK